jgi:hypothetical protein
MENFIDPEVIAGVILAFYFFARAATSLFYRKNSSGAQNGNGKIADATYKLEMRTKIDQLRADIDDIHKLLRVWDDKIQANAFSSPWVDREVGEVLTILRRIERNLL